MAVGVLGVLSLTGTTLVAYSSSNSRSAEYSREQNDAYVLADAGINEMMAVLSRPANNAMSGTLLPQTTSSYHGGTVTWSGTLNQATAVWTLRSTGRALNPTGPNTGAARRTLTANVKITPRETQPLQNNAWNYVFLYGTGSTCDQTIPSGFTWNSPLYVIGNLCLANAATITGGPVVVKQRLDLATASAAVGSSSTPISKAQIGIGCQYAAQHWHPDAGDGHPICSAVDNVHANEYSAPPDVPIPTVEWDTWYANAIPGPRYPCTYSSGTPPTFDTNTVRDGSVASEFSLAPATSSYSCRVGPADQPLGEITWDHVARRLVIRGTVFIDGSAGISYGATPISYDGHGSLYLSGTFRVANDNKLCMRVAASGTDCDYAGWNPNSEMLTIVAGGALAGVSPARSISIGAKARFQGALFGVNQIELAADAKTEGAIVAPNLQLGSRASSDPWDVVGTLPTGTPGTTPVFGYPNPPDTFSG
jgi:hypothetical protein